MTAQPHPELNMQAILTKNSTTDYYAVLGADSTSSREQIVTEFKARVRVRATAILPSGLNNAACVHNVCLHTTPHHSLSILTSTSPRTTRRKGKIGHGGSMSCTGPTRC